MVGTGWAAALVGVEGSARPAGESPRLTPMYSTRATIAATTSSEALEAQIAAFLNKGGQIQEIAKGVSADRLLAVGFGQNKPVADNATEEGKAKNRRTEFRVAELGGKKYLGLDPTGGGKVFE